MIFPLFFTGLLCIFWSIGSSFASVALNFSALEDLSELYYEDQKIERRQRHISRQFERIKPNYPCLYGVIPLGNSDLPSVEDGHKFACGVQAIKGAPIVYSYGSNQLQDFELSLLQLRPDAQIFVFDIAEANLPNVTKRDPRVRYSHLGLGGYNSVGANVAANLSSSAESSLKNMTTTMKELGHTHIDILKMDVEGSEFAWSKHESSFVAPRIGQFLVEVHVDLPQQSRANSAMDFVQHLEKLNFRVFHMEFNKNHPYCCTELSFIQRKWSEFETTKLLLPALQ